MFYHSGFENRTVFYLTRLVYFCRPYCLRVWDVIYHIIIMYNCCVILPYFQWCSVKWYNGKLFHTVLSQCIVFSHEVGLPFLPTVFDIRGIRQAVGPLPCTWIFYNFIAIMRLPTDTSAIVGHLSSLTRHLAWSKKQTTNSLQVTSKATPPMSASCWPSAHPTHATS